MASEFAVAGTPPKSAQWFAHRPQWIEVLPAPPAREFPDLDAGESEAIALALSLHADLLLVDERRATAVARTKANLATTGTLGVLLDAASLGLIDLPSALDRRKTETTFHAPPRLYEQILQEHRRRLRNTNP